jgi:hypothetical protein
LGEKLGFALVLSFLAFTFGTAMLLSVGGFVFAVKRCGFVMINGIGEHSLLI